MDIGANAPLYPNQEFYLMKDFTDLLI